MAKYKTTDYSQMYMVPIDFSKQILPGTFEFTINELIENKIDLSDFDFTYQNNDLGAPAYNPAVLLKIILYAYYKGIFSSRKIEEACHQNIVFMALSACCKPHFTTIANFVSSMGENINKLFLDILMVCDELNLIGYENFALDGCKMTSNASKEWSGKKADFINKRDKFKKTLALIQEQHQENDNNNLLTEEENQKYKKRIAKIQKKIEKLSHWVETNEDKPSTSSCRKGQIIQSNITDNESAKMQSSNGIIQGYNCQAVVDSKSQIVCYTEALGQSNDNHAFKPSINGVKSNLEAVGKADEITDSMLLADTGYHNSDTLDYIEENNLNAIVPDNQYRKRDPRFETKQRHTRAYNHNKIGTNKKGTFHRSKFIYHPENDIFICPEGNTLKCYGRENDNRTGLKYRSKKVDCNKCPVREKCLSAKSLTRTIFVQDRYSHNPLKIKMMNKIDSDEGRKVYSMRMGMIEPVFANICAAKRLDRINLRGKEKAGIQWALFCMVHNIEKIKNCKLKMAA